MRRLTVFGVPLHGVFARTTCWWLPLSRESAAKYWTGLEETDPPVSSGSAIVRTKVSLVFSVWLHRRWRNAWRDGLRGSELVRRVDWLARLHRATRNALPTACSPALHALVPWLGAIAKRRNQSHHPVMRCSCRPCCNSLSIAESGIGLRYPGGQCVSWTPQPAAVWPSFLHPPHPDGFEAVVRGAFRRLSTLAHQSSHQLAERIEPAVALQNATGSTSWIRRCCEP